ncbi:MAG: Gfo/Idh/MocA family oxidoreductase [Verrucomicrobia bacterium]|nr:Gfo/Idh/MocA family oxidoreductase [Verrucomicrobiota bacterium]
MQTLTRRNFLKSSLLTTGALSLSASSWRNVLGANEAVRVAVVGFRGRGAGHISELGRIPDARIVALCDVDTLVLDAAAKRFQDRGVSVQTHVDVRQLLEDKTIDAITTATPNHWHSLISIWACQAGKDVYVEKPVSHNVWEGRKVVEAARKYNRIVQSGTQSRSNAGLREALDWVRAGNLGKIEIARGLCYKPRGSIGKVDGPQPIPASINYDLWCGPAPNGPLMRKNLHYDWHWVWPTGNGDIGNQGIHQMDVCRWALGKPELSPKIISVGGRLGYVDDGETPNTQFAVHDYGDALLIFEVRGLPSAKGKKEMDKYRGLSIGHVIECEGGYLAGTTAFDKDGNQIRSFKTKGEENHMENFIKAVRSRKSSDLNADILEGHLSSALCHTSNISYRLGAQANPDAIRDAIRSDRDALETFGRMEEHLAANGVDLKKTKASLGMFLKMDGKAERFINNPAADGLLKDNYRAPYVVPEKV